MGTTLQQRFGLGAIREGSGGSRNKRSGGGNECGYFGRSVGRKEEADCNAEQEYEEKYGPITYYGNTSDSWHWNDGPWPWENEASMNRAKQAGRTIGNANIAMTQKERR